MPKRESNLNRKLAHTTKPTGGPVAQLETLADAAQLIARPREAFHEPGSDWIGNCCKDDRHAARCMLSGVRRGSRKRNNQFRREPYQFHHTGSHAFGV